MLVVLLGVLLTLVVFFLVRNQEDDIAHERLRRLAEEHYRTALRELADQQLVIESARALWAASDRVERHEFEEFVGLLLEGYPRLLWVAWAPAVPSAERAAFLSAAAEQVPDFELHELVPTGQRIAAREREVQYPVLYAAPAGAAGISVGFDLGSDVAQREAFERAAATGVRQTRGPYRHRRESEGLVYHTVLPVYARSGVPGSSSERAQSLQGFIVCAFDARQVVATSDETLARGPVAVEVVDAARGTPLAAAGSGGDPAPAPPADPPELSRTLDLGGLEWRLDYRTVARPGDVLHIPSYVLLAFGLALTSILALHLRSGRERGRGLAASNRELTRLVHEREQAELQARESQREFATLLSNLPGMAYRSLNQPDWPTEFVSDGCERLTGYRPAELQGGAVSFGDLIHPADRQRVWRHVQDRLAQQQPFELVYRLRAKGGDERWVWEQGRGVFDAEGRLDCIEGFRTDITAQRHAEQGLLEEKQFSDTAIDSLPGVFYLFDVDGRYLRWNQNLEQVTGYTHDEIERIHPLELVPEDERERVGLRISEVFATGSSTVEASLLTKEGRRIPYFFTGRRVTLDDRLCLLGMGVDVTDRVRAEEERRTIERKVQETQRLESIGLLAGGIAHDFNNLLTAVIGNVKFARDRTPEGPAHEFLGLAARAADRAADLTQQLLAYTGRASFERLPIDLSERIGELATLLSTSVPKKVALELQLAPDLPAVEADPTQVQQVVMNLVLNGAEACGEQPGVVRVRTEARTLEAGQVLDPAGEPLPAGRYVGLVVEDTGAGMDAETLAKIFDPFFTTKFTGRGLGLAAVLGIVRGHDGALEVRSRPGQGSSFEVLLPASPRPSVSAVRELPADLSGHGRILVVDDEPGVLRVIRQTLSDCGYEVVTARDGREALERFRRQADEIDLVLLDMTMPGMNGAEALAGIHALRPDVPALLSSGYDEELATREVLGAGLAGFIQKPYSPEALAAKVQEVLAARRSGSRGPA